MTDPLLFAALLFVVAVYVGLCIRLHLEVDRQVINTIPVPGGVLSYTGPRRSDDDEAVMVNAFEFYMSQGMAETVRALQATGATVTVRHRAPGCTCEGVCPLDVNL